MGLSRLLGNEIFEIIEDERLCNIEGENFDVDYQFSN